MNDIAFSSNLDNLICCSDNFIKLWRLEEKERKLIFEVNDIKSHNIDAIQSNICQFYGRDKYILFNSKNKLVFLEYELTEKKYKNNDILKAKTKGLYNAANVFEYKQSQRITYFNAVNSSISTQILISGKIILNNIQVPIKRLAFMIHTLVRLFIHMKRPILKRFIILISLIITLLLTRIIIPISFTLLVMIILLISGM